MMRKVMVICPLGAQLIYSYILTDLTLQVQLYKAAVPS